MEKEYILNKWQYANIGACENEINRMISKIENHEFINN